MMLTAQIQLLWRSLEIKEQEQVLALAPFQGVINLGEPIVEGYLESLRSISGFEHLEYPSFRASCRKLVDYGLAIRVESFSETELLKFVPGTSQTLRQQLEAEWEEQRVEELYQAFIAYYQELADQLYAMWLYTPDDERPENLAFLGHEYENLLGALEIGLQLGDFYFTPVFLLLETYWNATKQDQLRLQFSRSLLERLETVPLEQWDEHYRFSRVHVMDSAAAALMKLKDYRGSIKAYEEGLAQYRLLELDAAYPDAERSFYQNIASAYGFLGDWEESNAYYEKAVAIAHQYEDQEGLADYHLHIGKNLLNLQRYNEARSHFESAVDFFTELEQGDWVGVALGFLGSVALRERNYEQAAQHFNQALRLFEVLGDHSRKADILLEFGLMQLAQYAYEEAIHYTQSAMEWYISLGDTEKEGISYLILAGCSIGGQGWDDALDYVQRAALLFRNLGDEEKEQISIRIQEQIATHLLGEGLNPDLEQLIEVIVRSQLSIK